MSLLLAPFLDRAAHAPDDHVATFVDDRGRDAVRHTYGSLAARVRQLATWMRDDAGLRPGDRVLLLYPPAMDFFEVYAACLYAGVVAAPAYPPDPLRPGVQLAMLDAIARTARPRAILSTAAYRRAVQLGNLGAFLRRGDERWPDLPWLATDGARQSADGAPAHASAPGDLALIQFTSGSTSTPKGVRLTVCNLAHQVALCRAELAFTADSRLVMWVPPYHDLGLISGMTAALAGNGQLWFLSPSSFLRDPGVWFDVAHRVRGTHTASPNFGFALVTRRTDAVRRAAWDLSSLEVVMSAAEPIVPETMDAFFDAFAPTGLSPRAFRPAYGLAEHTVGVTVGTGRRLSFDRETAARTGLVRVDPEGDRTLVSCGAPAADVSVAIVRDGQPLREREIGEVWAQSPSVADGYEGTREGFDGVLPGRDGTWLRTGDFGFLDRGELFLTGRLKDLVVLRGKKLHPEDLEERVRRAHPDVRAGGVAAFSVPDGDSESLVVLAEVARDDQREAIAAAIHGVLGGVFGVRGEVVLLAPRSVPKTTSGKVRRAAARELWRAGRLRPLHTSGARVGGHAADGPIRDRLAAIDPDERVEHLARELLVRLAAAQSLPAAAEADLDVSVAELGVDSVMVAELLRDLEGWSGVALGAAVVADKPAARVLAARMLRAMEIPHTALETPPSSALEAHSARPPHRAIAPGRARVAIVGAGVAGLTAASELVRLGYTDLTVFEAAPEVGGKVRSVGFGDGVVELGQLFVPSSCRVIQAIAEAHGAPMRVMPRDHWTWTPEHGLQPGAATGPGITWLRRLIRAARQPATRELPLPAPGLEMPIGAFLQHNALRLHPNFHLVWDAMGYGTDLGVPTAYVVAYLQVYADAHFNGAVVGGNQLVWRRVAEDLARRWGVTVRTGTPVRALPPRQVVTDAGAEPFDEVLVTLAPGPLARVLPANDPVRALLPRFESVALLSVALRVEGLPEPMSLCIPRSGPGELVALRVEGGRAVALGYLGGAAPTPEGLIAAITEKIAEVGGRVVEVGPHASWDYFPHVRQDVAATLAAVEALQGVDGRWYAGSWLSFEMSEHVARHATHLVRTCFDPAFEPTGRSTAASP